MHICKNSNAKMNKCKNSSATMQKCKNACATMQSAKMQNAKFLCNNAKFKNAKMQKCLRNNAKWKNAKNPMQKCKKSSAKMHKCKTFLCNNAMCKNANMLKCLRNDAECKTEKIPVQQCKVQKCKNSSAGRCRSLNRSVGTLGFPLHWETRLVSIDKFEWEITSIAFLTWNVTFSFSHLFYAILPWKWNLLLRTVLCEVTKSYPSERVIWKPQCFFYKGIHFRTNFHYPLVRGALKNMFF